ncbi:MAG TPA: hypothetical protein VL443_02640 [Cyclobacteriaceae bacterium]|jgi:hypothetical protein|nr:hypothetical protein [Cyclobacteriaceae bacterium]
MSDLGVEFQLNKDETFIYRRFIYTDVIQDSMPRGSIYIVTGEYNRRRNRIVLNPKAYKEIQDWGESIIETRNGKYYESDSTAIKRRYHIVVWSGNTYLLSSEPDMDYNDFIEFANNYNKGYDPSWRLGYLAKRECLKKSTPLDLKQIPSEWKPYFLTSEVKVVVDKMTNKILFDSLSKTYWYEYQLKGGIKKQVRKGMILYGAKRCSDLLITESTRSSSKGYVYLCPSRQNIYEVGDTLKASQDAFIDFLCKGKKFKFFSISF